MDATRSLASLLAVGAFLAAAGCGGAGGSTTPPVTHSISGTVTGASGVTVNLTGHAAATTVTGAGGTFTFSGLADGSYSVTPSKAGFTFTPTSRSPTVTGADVTGQDFVGAAATFSISGTVTGASGVTVTLSGTKAATTGTGGTGAYTFGGLAAGAYTVTPSLAGYTFTPQNRPVTVGTADVPGQDFAAAPIVAGTHAITGTVSGSAVAGVTVTLSGAGAGSTATDASGAFAFTGLSDGSYTVTPSLVGHLFSPVRHVVALSGADATARNFAGTALVAYDDFSSGGISGARWESGTYHAVLDTQSALLGHVVVAPAPEAGYFTTLGVKPEAVAGRLTAFQATTQLTSSSVTGDSVARVGLELIFQPLANRVVGPDNFTNALFVRVALVDQASGLVAVRQVFACTSPSCSTTSAIGSAVAGGTWPAAGLAIARGTPYSLSIALDAATGVFTLVLSGGVYGTARTTAIDTSAGTAPPFPVDLSQANFAKARLFSGVRGGAVGGGSGSVEGRFDTVAIGQNGLAPVLFDDFSSGTEFAPGRWSIGGQRAEIVAGALELSQSQSDAPAITNLNLVGGASALQADVQVLQWSHTGTGQVGARLATALYNDGSGGLGTPPDVNGVSSQVGDLMAQISMSETDVSYAVVRCNVAVCSAGTGADLTFVQPRTSLKTITAGSVHTLRLSWDAATHLVSFQLDGEPPLAFDPVAAGHAVVSAPRRPFWQLSDHAGAAGPGVDFTAGSTGSIRAVFRNVKKL